MKETPQWLRDLQESSWELEFLISGGAIFTLVQAAGFFTDLIQSIKLTNELIGTDIFLILGAFGIQTLTLGFIMHLVLRAFWVALVCANYVYPQGVSTSRIHWKRPFRNTLPEGSDLYELILKINRLCSAVMYLSVISCFLVAGQILIGVLLITVPSLLGLRELAGYEYYFSLVTWCMVIYLADLLFFGLLRKIPLLSYLVYLPFRLFDFISGRFIYQRALWLYNTNVNRWKFAGVMSVFLVLAFFYSYAAIYRTLHWRNIFDQRDHRWQMAPQPTLDYSFYRDEADSEKVSYAQIPSKQISGDQLELFMVYRKEYDGAMLKYPGRFKYISEMVEISIDDRLKPKVAWHPTWRKDNDQMGITAMLPVKELEAGPHILTVRSVIDSARFMNIPFWKTAE